MKIYARLFDGLVYETFETDLDISELFHPEMTWVEVTDTNHIPEPGWSATEVKGQWTFAEPQIRQPTDLELKAAALAQRDALLAAANESTAGMADAYIAGLLNEEDEAKFKAYAAYKLKLNKIDTQAGYPAKISWPASPAS
jgi:hypothetical protein